MISDAIGETGTKAKELHFNPAAPLVTGVLACILSRPEAQERQWTVKDMQEVLLDNYSRETDQRVHGDKECSVRVVTNKPRNPNFKLSSDKPLTIRKPPPNVDLTMIVCCTSC